jgi:NitT/TauT family transport system ATP-binding protein
LSAALATIGGRASRAPLHAARGRRDGSAGLSQESGLAAPGGASAHPIIEIDGVSKTYRTRDGDMPSLRPVDFAINDGEFFVVVGPSGCGKTTLLKMIAGLLPPSEGEIRIDGRPVTKPHGGVGIVFQTAMLLPWRNVFRNVMMPVEVKKLPRRGYEARAAALLRMVGLEGFERKYPWQLSGGMQQRAAICRALVHDPRIVLMDEPFGALDALTRERMNVELQNIQRETRKTVFLITHSIPEAVFLADRVLVMTERPGAVAAVHDVPLPRPRSIDTMAEPAFAALTRDIRRHFNVRHGEL